MMSGEELQLFCPTPSLARVMNGIDDDRWEVFDIFMHLYGVVVFAFPLYFYTLMTSN